MEHGGWSDNWNVVRYRPVQCSAVQSNAVQGSGVLWMGLGSAEATWRYCKEWVCSGMVGNCMVYHGMVRYGMV